MSSSPVPSDRDAHVAATAMPTASSHWQELPPRYGPDAWELRVWNDHWYRVFGNRVVLCPIGIGLGVYSSTDEAKAMAERMYRQRMEAAVKKAKRTTLQANAGLAMLRG